MNYEYNKWQRSSLEKLTPIKCASLQMLPIFMGIVQLFFQVFYSFLQFLIFSMQIRCFLHTFFPYHVESKQKQNIPSPQYSPASTTAAVFATLPLKSIEQGYPYLVQVRYFAWSTSAQGKAGLSVLGCVVRVYQQLACGLRQQKQLIYYNVYLIDKLYQPKNNFSVPQEVRLKYIFMFFLSFLIVPIAISTKKFYNIRSFEYYHQIMNQETILDQYRNQSKVLIVSSNPYTAFAVPRTAVVQSSEQRNHNVILIAVSLVISQPLNFCMKDKADLIKIWIKNKLINISLQSVQGQYSFEELNYFMFLRASSNRLSEKVEISIDKVQYQMHRTLVQFKVRISQEGNPIQQLRKNNDVYLQIGNKNTNAIITSEISSFVLYSISNNSKLLPLESLHPNRIAFKDHHYQLPLTLFNSIHEIYSAFQINDQSPMLATLEKAISLLPKYKSIESDKENKIYFCHDMKGGYKEDISLQNNLDVKIMGQFVRYRSLHLEQSEIFNYFSHYNITIPPKHWRSLCKKYKTKCLGTFIIEKPTDQNFLCSLQLALFLVALAKKCQFDGYLINIETNIKSITAFKKWLDYLTKSIHNHIPNSKIIWYDSISTSDGVIRYQNGLNQVNYEFYHMTDGLFTNYWWNQDLLKQTLTYKKQNPKKVYIGNDCFGRNTYGGGQFDIYKATNKILQYKNQLSISLFAPGFTYEQKGAQIHRTLYHNQQMQMYKGVKSQYIPVKNWKYTKGKGKDWKDQAQWAVTSFELCQRTATFKFNSIDKNTTVKVFFNYEVTGTPSLIDSPYKIIIQLLDSDGNIVYQNSSHNFNDYKKATERIQFLHEQVVVDSDLIGDKEYSVKIIEMGKSRQYWGGHYGPRFRNQFISVLVYEKQKHWTSKIAISQLSIGQNYHSFCNMGFGDYFYYLGNKVQPVYNYLMDFDMPHSHIINHPFDTAFNYNSAFIGGSSFLVTKPSIKLFRAVIPEKLNLSQEYFLILTFKNTENINVVFKYVTKNPQERIFTAEVAKVDKINDWKRCTYKLITTQKEVNTDIRTIIDLTSQQFPYLIGEIKLIKKQKKQIEKVRCLVQISKERLNTTSYHLNLQINCKNIKRVLIVMQNHAGFAYFQNQITFLRNIPIKKSQEISIKIIDPDSFLQEKVLRQINISGQSLVDLIFKGKLSFD